MTTIDSSPIHFSPEPDSALGLSSRKTDEAAGKNGFAEVFAGLHAQPQHPLRTEAVAPAETAPPDPLLSPVMLQRVALSPAMQLIMPTTPAPDLASLQAFARAQGLDEQTIRQLLGDGLTDSQAMPQAQTAVVGGAVGAMGTALLGLPPQSAVTVTDAGADLPPSGVAPPGLLPPGWLRAVQPARPGLLAAQAPQAAGSSQAQAVEVMEIDLMATDAAVDSADALTAGLPKGLDAGQAGLLRPLWLSTDPASALKEATSSASGLAVVNRSAGAQAMMAGDLVRLDPAAMAALDDTLAGGGLSLEAGLPDQHHEAPSGQQGLVALGRPAGLQEATALVTRASAEAALPAGSGSQTAENLAHKLGEAIAQRLMSRLEQGNWQFRFVLNPRNMGEVQVNLHMHGGGLDGSFLASQAATRELLNDGLQRLRDTLSASGMNVANLDVGAGHSSRQGQQSMASALPQSWSGHRAQEQGSQEGLMPVRHRDSLGGEQGWDVLV